MALSDNAIFIILDRDEVDSLRPAPSFYHIIDMPNVSPFVQATKDRLALLGFPYPAQDNTADEREYV